VRKTKCLCFLKYFIPTPLASVSVRQFRVSTNSCRAARPRRVDGIRQPVNIQAGIESSKLRAVLVVQKASRTSRGAGAPVRRPHPVDHRAGRGEPHHRARVADGWHVPLQWCAPLPTCHESIRWDSNAGKKKNWPVCSDWVRVAIQFLTGQKKCVSRQKCSPSKSKGNPTMQVRGQPPPTSAARRPAGPSFRSPAPDRERVPTAPVSKSEHERTRPLRAPLRICCHRFAAKAL
jgi:hypothetical protein